MLTIINIRLDYFGSR